MSNSSISPVDRNLSGGATLGQNQPGSDGNLEGTFNSPELQDRSPTIICFSVSQGLLLGVLTLVQRCSRSIQQP